MDDDFWKRHLEETERYARLVDPLREFKTALENPMLRAQEQLAALCRDPFEDIREQLKALTNPLEQLPAWVKDNYGQDAIAKQLKEFTAPFDRVADQLKAAYGQDAIADQIKALLEPFNGAQEWIKAFRFEEEERLRQWSAMFDDFARQLRDLPDEIRGQLTTRVRRA